MYEYDDEPQREDENEEPKDDRSPDGGFRGSSDPLFGLLLVGAIAIGLIPLIDSNAVDMRYTLTWGLLASFGIVSWLLGTGPRIDQETPENLIWGIVFGMILGVPLLLFGSGSLEEATGLLFGSLTTGTVLAYLVFVMPLGETLFFRGILQNSYSFWSAGLICTVWQLVLFFPLMNRQAYPLIMGVIFLMANLMYGYVRERNGLAAAWFCQIAINLLVLFVPFVGIL